MEKQNKKLHCKQLGSQTDRNCSVRAAPLRRRHTATELQGYNLINEGYTCAHRTVHGSKTEWAKQDTSGTYVGVHAVSLARHRAVRVAAIDHWCGRGKGRQGLGAGQGRAGHSQARNQTGYRVKPETEDETIKLQSEARD